MLLKQQENSTEALLFLQQQQHATLKRPEEFIAKLRAVPTLPTALLKKEIVGLEVALRTLPVSWVGEFVAAGGVSTLCALFREYSVKVINEPAERETQHQMIRCFKTLMNNAIGLSAIINHPEGIPIVSLGLDCASTRLKATVLELLGAVCLVPPEGHKKVVSAMDYYRKAKNEKYRFQSVIADLMTDEFEYQVSGSNCAPQHSNQDI